MLLALLGVVAVRAFLLEPFSVPSESMQPTLEPGDRILVGKWTRDIHRGDIVVFDGRTTWGPVSTAQPSLLDRVSTTLTGHSSLTVYVKRVVGLGGEHLKCCDGRGRITVNGVPLDEPYLATGEVPSATPFDVVVPPGRVWLMGDHRSRSADSRAHLASPGGGTVSLEDVIGPVAFRYWPPTRVGALGSAASGQRHDDTPGWS